MISIGLICLLPGDRGGLEEFSGCSELGYVSKVVKLMLSMSQSCQLEGGQKMGCESQPELIKLVLRQVLEY